MLVDDLHRAAGMIETSMNESWRPALSKQRISAAVAIAFAALVPSACAAQPE